MSHQDSERNNGSAYNHQDLRGVIEWLLAGAVFSNVQFRRDSRWAPQHLIAAALWWTWSDEKTLKDRFFTSRKIVLRAWRLKKPPATS